MITQSVSERRQQTNKLIQELLEERKEVWSEYGKLASMQPFARHQPMEIEVRRFCQIMIDYVSLGHFGIYQRITDGNERRRRVLETAERIYPRIAEATDAAVEFNDKYDRLDGDDLRINLATDLSRLGEELAMRFELEDQLVAVLLD